MSLAVDEAHLHVDLRELRLPVGTRVLVAEAADDLEVPLDAADHQNLLEELRRLRQGVKRILDQPAGHQEVTCPFRRALGQHGRLDFPEPQLVEVVPHEGRDLVPDLQPVLRHGPPQVDIAVGQPNLLGRLLGAVDVERRGLRLVQDLHLLDDDFDLSRGELGVFEPFAARPDHPGHRDHPLAAHVPGHLVSVFGRLGIEHQLRQPGAVAQIEEHQTAVIPIRLYPPGQRHLLAGVIQPQLTARVRPFQHNPFSRQLLSNPNRTRRPPSPDSPSPSTRPNPRYTQPLRIGYRSVPTQIKQVKIVNLPSAVKTPTSRPLRIYAPRFTYRAFCPPTGWAESRLQAPGFRLQVSEN